MPFVSALFILFFFRFDNGEEKLIQLCSVNIGGTLRHELAGVLHLRESGNVPDVVGTAENHRQTVQAVTHADVGRRTVTVGIYQEAKLCLNFLVGETQGTEHLLLKLKIGDADGTAAQLDAV